MAARAIWKGNLVLGAHEVPIKMYSAVQDQAVHFHLLHDKDLTPVEQRIVRKDNGREVPKEQQRKAFPLDEQRAVILEPEELEQLAPESDRAIHLLRFVPREVLGEEWFDRPYYLGPDGEGGADYFALASALSGKERIGIARWVMRDKHYVGALAVGDDGYLRMTTLRRSEQVLDVPAIRPDQARTPSPAEIKLAEQLVDSITGPFAPEEWHNEYRERLHELIEAKAKGAKLKLVAAKPREATSDLAETLRASLARAKGKKVA
ncbi:MAG: Ku protein [Rhizobacter sp.]|nr:Ku protein [Rhizobacter sp.]